MTDRTDRAHDDTLPVVPAHPNAGRERGTPTASDRVGLGSGAGMEATLPGDPNATQESHGSGATSVRANNPADYPTLIAVDPAHYVRAEEIARGGIGRIVA